MTQASGPDRPGGFWGQVANLSRTPPETAVKLGGINSETRHFGRGKADDAAEERFRRFFGRAIGSISQDGLEKWAPTQLTAWLRR